MPMGMAEGIISIHSLVKRETLEQALPFTITIISIHSLVKRETLELREDSHGLWDFNPLPRKEGDKQPNVINLKRLLNGKQNVWKYQNGEEKSDSDGREKDV